jgi:hypothetical protein
MSPDVVTVGRMTVNCIVPRDHPNIERVRWRLNEVAAAPLRRALEELLAPLGALRSDEVVIIRRLELSFDLDTSREVSDVARRWAARLAAQLAQSLQAGSRTTGMLRFPDQAGYLARFLVDTAAGRAAGKWYYRRYRGLTALSIPATLRTALLEDSSQGLAALRSLDAAEHAPVLDALGAREARRVVETIAAGGDDGGGPDQAAAALLPVIAAWRASAVGFRSPWSSALALLALGSIDLAAPSLPAVARLAAALASWVWDKREATASHIAAIDSAPALAPVFALPSTARQQLEAALGRDFVAVRVPGAAPPGHTPFGGLVLLLRHVGELPIDAIWPDARDRAIARLLVLARCAGGGRYERVLADPVVQRLCGMPTDDTPPPLLEWLATNSDRMAQSLAPALARDRLAAARSIRLTVGRDSNVGALSIRIAEPEGYWLGLEPMSASLRAALRPRGASSGLATTRDLRLAAVRATTRVLSYLALPGWLSMPIDADLCLTLAAQHVLRAFARRLPGFSESSPAYLYENFLAFPATVEETAVRLVCRTGRPPLAALFGITGALRGQISLPWLGPPLEIFSGG